MKKISLCVFIVSLCVILHVNEAGFLKKISKPFERIGKEIRREVKDVGKAIEHVGKAVGKVGEKVLKPVLKPIGRVVSRSLKVVVRPVVKLIQKRRKEEVIEVVETVDDTTGIQATTETFEVGMIRLHNELRSIEGVTGTVAWDARLAQMSAEWITQCSLKYPVYGDSRDSYGQNAFMTTSATAEPIDAINTWYSYKSNFNPATGDCLDGQVCDPYLQAVMPESQYVGCATGTCPSFSGGPGGSTIFCMYAPL
ncbi:hypothetical protein HELRODRAFT_160549 [Helobdella robusta]|uniref:SCP domain-containing protein n=1 Tax=Helobdella robusta TaxID=6412 RepID=T1EQE5_HELRO|nr:hypothetical protein HELRODRAFT_160549 [Helobdella robusta]ESO06381.1 hypothetical protein HELRODRAFT_160549 [Helobdella robusta]